MTGAPDFTAGSELLAGAWELAAEAHDGQERKGDGTPYIRHPGEVATLLRLTGVEDEAMLAAAFLHDVVEDTDVGIDAIYERFGDDVGDLVAAMTEDKDLSPYRYRKEHHRDQVEAAGERAIAIYAADKVANLRDLRRLYASVGEGAAVRFKAPLDERVELWRGDAEMVSRAAPELTLLADLEAELVAFDKQRAAVAG